MPKTLTRSPKPKPAAKPQRRGATTRPLADDIAPVLAQDGAGHNLTRSEDGYALTCPLDGNAEYRGIDPVDGAAVFRCNHLRWRAVERAGNWTLKISL